MTIAFIFPGGKKKKGILEDLCLASVAGENGISCVQEFFQCIRRNAKRKPKNLAKAKVCAWLASQEKSDLRLGEAAEKGYWNWDNPAFKQLKSFLGKL
jgi:hypothetical protein